MQLYVIANLHNQTVLDKKGIWMSTANSKSALRNVCWFDSPDVAKRACAPYNPNSVAVLTAKNLCKRIGIKKIPGYIQENYKGSVLSKTMRIGIGEGECPQNSLNIEPQAEKENTYGHELVDAIPGIERNVCSTSRKSRYLELSGCDPIVMQSLGVANIQKELAIISDINKNWKERQATVLELLKYIEERERDLLHVIEFYNLRKEEAELAVHELHIVRCERRQLKNEFTALSAAIRVIVNISPSSIESATKNIEKLYARKYYCRTITEDRLPEWLDEIVKRGGKV